MSEKSPLAKALKEVRSRLASEERRTILSAYKFGERCGLRVEVIQKWEMGLAKPRVEAIPGLLRGSGRYAYIILEALGFSQEDMDNLAISILERPVQQPEKSSVREVTLLNYLTKAYQKIQSNLDAAKSSEKDFRKRSMDSKSEHAHRS